MKQTLLALAGRALSSRVGFFLLTKYAFRTPHAHLHDADGSLYMGRWRVVDKGTRGGRLLHWLTGYESIRLHHICRPDHDRDLHNHPFNYRTFILNGWYNEEFRDAVSLSFKADDGLWWNGNRNGIAPFRRVHGGQGLRFVKAGDTATGNAVKFHRITSVSDGGVWTLFCMTKNTETWGFDQDGRFVEATRYLIRRGYPRGSIRATQTP